MRTITNDWKPMPSIPIKTGILFYNVRTDELAAEEGGKLIELEQTTELVIRTKYKYQLQELKACHPL